MNAPDPGSADSDSGDGQPAWKRASKWLSILLGVLLLPLLACGTFTTNPASSDPGAAAAGSQQRPVPTSTPITIPTPLQEAANSPLDQGLGGVSANMGNPTSRSNVSLVVGERAQVVAGSGLNLREYSSLAAPAIWKLSAGDHVEVLQGPFVSEDLFWWRVRTIDAVHEGMIAEGAEGQPYLEPAANVLVPVDRDPVQGDIVRVMDNLNLRREPGLNAQLLITLPAGQELQILDGPVHQSGYDWYQVRNESDTLRGWCVAAIGGRRTLRPLE